MQMVRAAHEAGARAVKFQTLRADALVGPGVPARVARLKGFELSADQYRALSALTHELGMLFLSTPLDLESAAMLRPLVDAYKIASGDITFVPLLEAVADSGLPVIVSTGASTLLEVERAVTVLSARETAFGDRLALLHCVSSYPAPPDQLNLLAIPTLRARFPRCTIGYSDHALGSDAVLAAAALGARIIEKHFTLDKNLSDFRDHQLSADPPEFRALVEELPTIDGLILDRIPNVDAMLGSGEKVVMPCETETRRAIRRSICAHRDLAPGTVLAASDLTWLRPEGGFAPGMERSLIGSRLAQAVSRGVAITNADLEQS